MHDKGVTLIELLISLTILSMIVVLVFSAFRVGIRVWEKGGANVETNQRMRTVLELFRHQIASVCVRNFPKDKPFYLKGEEKHLELLSDLSLVPGNPSGIVKARYRVAGDPGSERLIFFEERAFKKEETSFKTIVINSESESESEEPDEDQFHQLLSGIHQIRFSYLKDSKEELTWQPEWTESGFPIAVRMTLMENEDALPVNVTVRILSEIDKEN